MYKAVAWVGIIVAAIVFLWPATDVWAEPNSPNAAQSPSEPTAETTGADGRPDILLILTDQFNPRCMGCADHGEMLGAHGRLSKVVFYEESVRVPLLVRWPGRVKAGLRTGALVDLLDVYATIVDAASGRMSETAHGVSLLPVCSGETDRVHDAVFSEIGPGKMQNYMVRAGRWKYFVWKKREHLFDLEADPYELKDLARSTDPESRQALSNLRKQLSEFLPGEQRNVTGGYKPLFTRIRGDDPDKPLAELLAKERVKWERAQRASVYLRGAIPQPPAVK